MRDGQVDRVVVKGGKVGRGLAVAVTAMLLASVATARLADTDAGTVEITVLNAAGSPLGGVPLILNTNTSGSETLGPGGGAKKPTHPGRTEAKDATDEKGKLVVQNLKPGRWGYKAGTLRMGLTEGTFSVEGGKTVTVEIKLDPPPK